MKYTAAEYIERSNWPYEAVEATADLGIAEADRAEVEALGLTEELVEYCRAVVAAAKEMTRYSVTLGCACPGAIGWTAFYHADTPQSAMAAAEAHATPCCTCGTVVAASADAA